MPHLALMMSIDRIPGCLGRIVLGFNARSQVVGIEAVYVKTVPNADPQTIRLDMAYLLRPVPRTGRS